MEVLVHRTPKGVCDACCSLPLTTKTITFVGSYDKALCRNYRQPAEKMVLVVEGMV